jgi:hypothetical protein
MANDRKMVRLANPNICFVDSAGAFDLAGDEQKALPSELGDLTRKWLNAGGIVYCDPQGDQTTPVIEKQELTESELNVASTEDAFQARVKELGAYSLQSLREKCKSLGIKFAWKEHEDRLSVKIATKEFKAQE